MKVTSMDPQDMDFGEQLEKREVNLDELNLHELAQRHDWREILLDIVKKEDMNPWDVNINKLVDEYVSVVRAISKTDFRVPANAILASSILLREKSNSWVLKEEKKEESIWDKTLITPDQIPPPREQIPEPKPKKRRTKRKVSVDELIDAVDEVIQKEKKKAREKAKEGTQEEPKQNIIPDQLLELAKQRTNNFEEQIEDTKKKIIQNLDEEKLTTFTNIINPDEDSRDVINTLLSLLHLANKGTVSMWQEEVFGEIFIHYPEEEEDGDKENN